MEIDVLKIIGSEATGMHSIVEEILKNGGNSIIDWLLRIFKRSMETGVVTGDWKVVCISPIHKG